MKILLSKAEDWGKILAIFIALTQVYDWVSPIFKNDAPHLVYAEKWDIYNVLYFGASQLPPDHYVPLPVLGCEPVYSHQINLTNSGTSLAETVNISVSNVSNSSSIDFQPSYLHHRIEKIVKDEDRRAFSENRESLLVTIDRLPPDTPVSITIITSISNFIPFTQVEGIIASNTRPAELTKSAEVTKAKQNLETLIVPALEGSRPVDLKNWEKAVIKSKLKIQYYPDAKPSMVSEKTEDEIISFHARRQD